MPDKRVAAAKREAVVQQFMHSKLDQLRAPRIKSRSSLGCAEWLLERNEARVLKSKGSLGSMRDGVRFLSAYETLLAMESMDYEVSLAGLPLSLEEAYSLCLADERDLDVYRVYANLMKSGFRVWKLTAVVVGEEKSETSDRTSESRDQREAVANQEVYSSPERKRRRRNSDPSPGDLLICNLQLSHVRHREFVVPPIFEHLKANARNWTDYKEINGFLDSEFVGRVVDTSGLPSRDLSSRLPSSLLSKGITKCVNQFDSIPTLSDLSSRLQERGPQEYIPSLNHDVRKIASLRFETEDRETGYVIVVSREEPLPPVHVLSQFPGEVILLTAVVDESLISLFRLTRMSKWKQLPRLWLQHVV